MSGTAGATFCLASTLPGLCRVSAVSGPPEFYDARLVAIYDSANAYGPESQPAFYRQLAADLRASSIIDLGCGTGMITCELAALGYDMIGVDPAPEMLKVARMRPKADKVTWIEGDVHGLGRQDADLAIMTGHVAQFFVSDTSWSSALAALRIALRPGGHLAFESRNPTVREWEDWTPQKRRVVDDPEAGLIERWPEVHEVQDGVVSYTIHNLFLATGEEVLAPTRIRFRSQDELTGSLREAGFTVENIYGDWDRQPASPSSRELIYVASR